MKERIPILVDLYKGIAAIVMGILLFFFPDKSSSFLLNTMGFFWLTIGFTSLRRGQEDERYPGKYTKLIAGLVACRDWPTGCLPPFHPPMGER